MFLLGLPLSFYRLDCFQVIAVRFEKFVRSPSLITLVAPCQNPHAHSRARGFWNINKGVRFLDEHLSKNNKTYQRSHIGKIEFVIKIQLSQNKVPITFS